MLLHEQASELQESLLVYSCWAQAPEFPRVVEECASSLFPSDAEAAGRKDHSEELIDM